MELVVEVGGVTIPGRSYETKFPKIARKNSNDLLELQKVP